MLKIKPIPSKSLLGVRFMNGTILLLSQVKSCKLVCDMFIALTLQKEGELRKYKNLWSGWGKRYFKLERMYLHYFESKDVSAILKALWAF